jgi:hypothetical protein
LFPLPFLDFSVDKKQPPPEKLFFFSFPRRCYIPQGEHVPLSSSLRDPIVVGTQGRPPTRKINSPLIKLEVSLRSVRKKRRDATSFAVGGEE